MDEGIGERYLRETRHGRGHLVGGGMDWARQPSWFKTYPRGGEGRAAALDARARAPRRRGTVRRAGAAAERA